MALGYILCDSEFKSDQGVQYKITIYDAEGSLDLDYPLTCGSDGFILNYDGKGKKRYNYIQASKVNFQLNIPNASHPAAAMIANLSTAEAGRYKVLIESSTNDGASYSNYWRGVIVSDIQKRKDISYPYFFDFTAVDGLSLMRDIPFNKDVYNGVNDDVTNLRTLIKHISNMFRYYNPTYDFFNATESCFYELVHWYEDSMPSPSGAVSPLEYSAVYGNAFMGLEVNEEGSVESTNPITAYEVLEQILKTFGAKIVQAKGYWWITNIEQYAHLTDGILYYRRFEKDGSKIGGGTQLETNFVKELGSVSDAHSCVKLSGGIYSFLPKVQEYRASYSNWTSSGLYSETEEIGVWPGTSTAVTTLANLGFVVAVAGAGINITHRLQYKAKVGGTLNDYDYLYVKYMLKVGNHYWNGDSWQLNATTFDTDSLFIEPYVTQSYQDFGEYPQASFQTTEFPANGDVLFNSFVVEGAWYNNNYVADYDMRQLANTSTHPSAVQVTINESTDVKRTFSSSNNTTIANTIEDLGECLLGDGPTTDAPSWGRLRVSTDGTTFLNTIEENWQAWEVGSESRITNILCQQALFGQNNYIPLNEYNIFLRNKQAHSFNPTIAFDDNTSGGDRMVCQGYKFNAAKDEVSGQYWKAAQDSTDVVINNLDSLTAAEAQVGNAY